MRKQFSFKEFLLYALRYWVITAVCIVIGLGAAFCMALLGRAEKVRYEGQAEIAGITTLYPDVPETEKETTSVYNTVCNHAMSAMWMDSNITELYNVIGEEYCSIMRIKNSNNGELSFRKAFSFSNTSIAFKVAFTMTGNKANKAFCEKAVNGYLEIAVASAKAKEKVLEENDASIMLRNAERMAVPRKSFLSTLISKGLIGGVGGVLGGLVVSLIVYFVDPRMTSYRDIAAVTGKRLLSATRGEADESVCPKIDSIMADDRLLLLCGDAAACERLALLYGKYSTREKGALVVRFGRAN
ncbi:MAG: hypothetical protein K2M95_01270, partial [Clostridiales bacterium]|nr:hypothetical protein [Clostridiales bacterium]